MGVGLLGVGGCASCTEPPSTWSCLWSMSPIVSSCDVGAGGLAGGGVAVAAVCGCVCVGGVGWRGVIICVCARAF